MTTAVKKPRVLRYKPTTQKGIGLLWIRVGKAGLKSTSDETYTVHRVPVDGDGVGFLVVKANLGQPDAYHVLLDGLQTSCECKGFTRHQTCKHVDALQYLHQRGSI